MVSLATVKCNDEARFRALSGSRSRARPTIRQNAARHRGCTAPDGAFRTTTATRREDESDVPRVATPVAKTNKQQTIPSGRDPHPARRGTRSPTSVHEVLFDEPGVDFPPLEVGVLQDLPRHGDRRCNALDGELLERPEHARDCDLAGGLVHQQLRD